MKIFNVVRISIDYAEHDYTVTWLDKQILKQFATIDKAIEYLENGYSIKSIYPDCTQQDKCIMNISLKWKIPL